MGSSGAKNQVALLARARGQDCSGIIPLVTGALFLQRRNLPRKDG